MSDFRYDMSQPVITAPLLLMCSDCGAAVPSYGIPAHDRFHMRVDRVRGHNEPALASRQAQTLGEAVAQLPPEQRDFGQPWGSHPNFPVENAPSQPLFDSDGREVGPDWPIKWPLISTCRCGRQVGREREDAVWQHVD